MKTIKSGIASLVLTASLAAMVTASLPALHAADAPVRKWACNSR